MKTRTKVIIGSGVGIGLIATTVKVTSKIIQLRMLNQYNLNHSNSPLLPNTNKTRRRIRSKKNMG